MTSAELLGEPSAAAASSPDACCELITKTALPGVCVCTKCVCVKVDFFGSHQGSRCFCVLAPPAHIYIHRHGTHRGDLGTACRGHVEVCAAVAQPQSRSNVSSTSPLHSQGDPTPGSQASRTEPPPRGPKCKSRTRIFHKKTHTRLQRGTTKNKRRTASRCVQSLVSSFGDFRALFF